MSSIYFYTNATSSFDEILVLHSLTASKREPRNRESGQAAATWIRMPLQQNMGDDQESWMK